MKSVLFLFPPKESASSEYYFRVSQEIKVLSKKFYIKIIDPVSKIGNPKSKLPIYTRIFKLIFFTPKTIFAFYNSDLIIVYPTPLLYFYVLFIKLMRKKILMDHFTSSIYNFELTNNPLKKLFMVLDWLTYQSFDKLLTHSDSMRKVLISHYRIKPNKVTTLYSSVDTNFFKKRNAKKLRDLYSLAGKKVIMYHGLFHPFHGVNTILEVARRYKKKDVVFFLIGQKLNFEMDNVISINPVKYVELPYYLSLADLWIGALGKGVQGNRALSSNMIGAMSMGLPIIVGNLPENKLVIKNGVNGFLIPKGDTNELLRQIIRLRLKDLKKVGYSARTTIKDSFDVRKLEQKLLTTISNEA